MLTVLRTATLGISLLADLARVPQLHGGIGVVRSAVTRKAEA